jgi:hypothetical protein
VKKKSKENRNKEFWAARVNRPNDWAGKGFWAEIRETSFLAVEIVFKIWLKIIGFKTNGFKYFQTKF